MRSSINIAHRASVHVEIMPRAPSVLQGSDHPNQTSWPSYLVQFSRTPHISLLGLLEGWLWLATLGALLLLLVLHRSAAIHNKNRVISGALEHPMETMHVFSFICSNILSC